MTPRRTAPSKRDVERALADVRQRAREHDLLDGGSGAGTVIEIYAVDADAERVADTPALTIPLGGADGSGHGGTDA